MVAQQLPLESDFPPGAWVLGFNQKQGASNFQAGARALLIPSELTRALSSSQGRIAAQTLQLMGVSQSINNYAAFRPYAIMESIRRWMPKDVLNPVILDPTAGYGPEYIWLAQEYPDAQFIEMDHPDIIRDKLRRLKNITLPKNVFFEGVDLSIMPLGEALREREIHIIVMLATYVNQTQFTESLVYLKSILPKGTVVIALFPYQLGLAEMARANIFFRRFATEPVGIVKNETQACEIFANAQYQDITTYTFSQLAQDIGKPIPLDIELVVVGRC